MHRYGFLPGNRELKTALVMGSVPSYMQKRRQQKNQGGYSVKLIARSAFQPQGRVPMSTSNEGEFTAVRRNYAWFRRVEVPLPS